MKKTEYFRDILIQSFLHLGGFVFLFRDIGCFSKYLNGDRLQETPLQDQFLVQPVGILFRKSLGNSIYLARVILARSLIRQRLISVCIETT